VVHEYDYKKELEKDWFSSPALYSYPTLDVPDMLTSERLLVPADPIK